MTTQVEESEGNSVIAPFRAALPRIGRAARNVLGRVLSPASFLAPVRGGAFAAGAAQRDVGLALLRALGSRDSDTAQHSSRVAVFAKIIADELAFPRGTPRDDLELACLLHDLGKLHVPLDVLHKPSALDDCEWDLMRAHAPDGERMVAASLSPGVARIVGQHHERMDGQGYPFGLPGDLICLEARIVAVADAFDAMTSDRPYREALEPADALVELRRSAGLDGAEGGQFDPRVVVALTATFSAAAARCAGHTK